jgi:YD repeat-containing protein
LKFGDFEREFIAKNKIDTTYIVAKNPTMKWKFGELLGSSIDDTTQYLNWKFMDAGFVSYDSLGRTISDQSMRWRDYRYFYDSLGLLDSIVYRDWDVMPKYSST